MPLNTKFLRTALNVVKSFLTKGEVLAWGDNTAGELGLKDVELRSSPVQIGSTTLWKTASTARGTGPTTHSMAIREDGSLWAWGYNSSGELGDETIISKSSPIQIGTLTNWSKIYCGGQHTFGLKTDGTLWAWGEASFGRLGDGSVVDKSCPVQIGSDTDWSKLSTHESTVFSVKTDGTLWAWGNGALGRLGDGSTADKSSPVQIGSLTTWANVSAGFDHAAAIKIDGTLWIWGDNSPYGELGDGTKIDKSSPVQIGNLTNWKSLALGSSASIALKTDKTLWGWGFASGGRLGDGTTVNKSSPVQIGSLNNWESISTGGGHTIAIKDNGTMWTWGDNSPDGELGDGTVIDKSTPVQIGILDTWLSASAGADHTLAIKKPPIVTGELWSWGENQTGQLGIGSVVDHSSPIQVGASTSWKVIASGGGGANFAHVAAIKDNNTLWIWGDNGYGQLGDGTTVDKSSPIQVGWLVDWATVTCGTQNNHTKALKTDGTLWSWGDGNVGVSGLGNVIDYSSPMQIGNLTDWREISTFRQHVLAIKTDGTLWSWGEGASGRLGHNNSTDQSSPVQVGTLTDWNKIVAGQSHSLAIKTNGSLWAWGDNGLGQLGDGISGVNRSSPVPIGSLTTWTGIAIGSGFSIATREDGTIWSWGYNLQGQLGHGDVVYLSSPTQIGVLTNWSSLINTGEQHIHAIKQDGTLWAWGENSPNGELGLGDGVNRSSPVQVGALNTWIQISSGSDQTLGLIGLEAPPLPPPSPGELWSWGVNGEGQLGNETTVSESSPIQVGGLSNWSAVYASSDNNSGPSFGLKEDGTMWTWGNAGTGVLGDGTVINKSSPTQIGSLTDWSKMTVGSSTTTPNAYFAGAIKSDGTLWIWGDSLSGALGDGQASVDRSSPVQLGSDTDWRSISSGELFTLATKTDLSLWAWGKNLAGRLGDGTVVDKSSPVQIGSDTDWDIIATGTFNGMAIKTDGTLWVWGNGTAGANGQGNVTSLSSPTQLGSFTDWRSVDGGVSFVMATNVAGSLWTWGNNVSGKLGLGNTTYTSSPIQVGELTDWTSNVSTGDRHVVARKTDGTLWSWGDSSPDGETGHGDVVDRSSPVQIGTLTTWLNVKAGPDHTLGIKSYVPPPPPLQGTLWAWGDSTDGRLGDGQTTTDFSSPIQIGSDTNWSFIDTGGGSTGGHSMALKADGTLWSWGNNADGRLGLGDITVRSSPVQVGALTNWDKLSCGNADPHAHALAIKTDGTLWAWGNNNYGELGDGTTIDKSSPISIGALIDWAEISCGGYDNNIFSLALKTDGTIWSWGDGLAGQLGLGDLLNRSSPTQIGSLTTWAFIDATMGQSMAVKTDGTLWAWGANDSGRLGLGNTADRSSPVQVGTLTDWVTITGGGSVVSGGFTIAVKTDGTLWSWGDGANGKTAQGITTDISSPVQVGALTNWSSVDSSGGGSGSHTLAIKTDGTLWSWGDADTGRLGDNSVVHKSSPVQIGSSTNWIRIATAGGSSAGSGFGIKTE